MNKLYKIEIKDNEYVYDSLNYDSQSTKQKNANQRDKTKLKRKGIDVKQWSVIHHLNNRIDKNGLKDDNYIAYIPNDDNMNAESVHDYIHWALRRGVAYNDKYNNLIGYVCINNGDLMPKTIKEIIELTKKYSSQTFTVNSKKDNERKYNDSETEENIDEIYTIPLEKFDKLQKVITRIQNKGAPVQFEKLEETEIPVYPVSRGTIGNLPIGYVKAVKVKVNGSFKINDWTLIAKIDHDTDENGNPTNVVVRTGDNKIPIPKEYFEAKPECDYCHTRRPRNNTFVLYNEKENKYIHVGGECLKYFTEGLDAKTTAEFLDILYEIKDLDINENGVDEDFLSDLHLGYEKSDICYTDTLISTALNYFQSNKGYYRKGNAFTEGTSASEVFDEAIENGNNDSNISEAKEFINKQNDDKYSDYWTNVQHLIQKTYIERKYASFIVSAVHIYYDDVKNQESSNSYLGNVGDKITFTISQIKILWKNDNRGYSYYAPPSYTYRIVDNENNVIIWTTDKNLEKGMTITATIKQLKEFRGEKQTVVTRGKIL